METLSPCQDCRHCIAEEIIDGQYQYECDEDIPDDAFGTKWGCFLFWERPEEQD